MKTGVDAYNNGGQFEKGFWYGLWGKPSVGIQINYDGNGNYSYGPRNEEVSGGIEYPGEGYGGYYYDSYQISYDESYRQYLADQSGEPNSGGRLSFSKWYSTNKCNWGEIQDYPTKIRSIHKNEITYFSQRDVRWANIIYSKRTNPKECSKQTIGLTGCGPTSLANSFSNKLGYNIYPDYMAEICLSIPGCRTWNSGTDSAYFGQVAAMFGLRTYQTTDINIVKKELSKGNAVVVSVKDGYFTGGGHFMSLVDISPLGSSVYVLDPFNPGKNGWWGADWLHEQSKFYNVFY